MIGSIFIRVYLLHCMVVYVLTVMPMVS